MIQLLALANDLSLMLTTKKSLKNLKADFLQQIYCSLSVGEWQEIAQW